MFLTGVSVKSSSARLHSWGPVPRRRPESWQYLEICPTGVTCWLDQQVEVSTMCHVVKQTETEPTTSHSHVITLHHITFWRRYCTATLSILTVKCNCITSIIPYYIHLTAYVVTRCGIFLQLAYAKENLKTTNDFKWFLPFSWVRRWLRWLLSAVRRSPTRHPASTSATK